MLVDGLVTGSIHPMADFSRIWDDAQIAKKAQASGAVQSQPVRTHAAALKGLIAQPDEFGISNPEALSAAHQARAKLLREYVELRAGDSLGELEEAMTNAVTRIANLTRQDSIANETRPLSTQHLAAQFSSAFIEARQTVIKDIRSKDQGVSETAAAKPNRALVITF